MSLREQITELYNLHLACINQDHGVLRTGDRWRPYIPTKFIYAFFTFDSIYSFSWEESLKYDIPIEWDLYEKYGDEEKRAATDSKKIRKLVNFCIHRLGIDGLASFSHNLKKYLPETDHITVLNNIVPDRKTDKMVSTFQNKFKYIYNGEFNDTPDINKAKRKAIESILYFVYLVRNNIFHGTKTIHHMDIEQQQRIQIYTAIIIAANELFFDAIETDINWKRPRISLGRVDMRHFKHN